MTMKCQCSKCQEWLDIMSVQRHVCNGGKVSYQYELKDQALDLAAKLDNPASVMIRQLLEKIEELETFNSTWSDKYWKLVEQLKDKQK